MNGRRGYQVAVRLDRQELVALRRIRGVSDAERFRALLHQETLAELLAEQIGEAIRADGAETRRYLVEFSRRLQAVLQPGR
jgi:ribosomal protein S7